MVQKALRIKNTHLIKKHKAIKSDDGNIRQSMLTIKLLSDKFSKTKLEYQQLFYAALDQIKSEINVTNDKIFEKILSDNVYDLVNDGKFKQAYDMLMMILKNSGYIKG